MLFAEVMTPCVADGEPIAMRKLSEHATPASLVILADIRAAGYGRCGCDDVRCVCDSVYKVETVGSEYMTVSGLPAACAQPRNTAQAMMQAAAAMLRAMRSSKHHGVGAVRANYEQWLWSRSQLCHQIGMERGIIAAETILGRWVLPRWNLFGDSVNTASRYSGVVVISKHCY